MRKTGIGQDRILKRVELAFARHRRLNRGRASYSKPLRVLAVSAIESGITLGKVVQAAGVSQQSLINWRGAYSVEAPRELQLVNDSLITAKAAGGVMSRSESPACIRLRSGVSI